MIEGFRNGPHNMANPSPSNDNRTHLFVVREYVNGVLIPLAALLERLPCGEVVLWAFRDATLHGGCFCGHSPIEFERLSREERGLCVPAADLMRGLNSDSQLLDGEIDGYVDRVGSKRLLTIECFDASQWEIATDSAELAAELEKRGFLRA